MYKGKPEQRNTNRLRLDIESKLPDIYTVESQLHEAKGRRGCLVELPWQGYKSMQLWILAVQWDTNGDLPVWTLFEQYGAETKTHWSNKYAPGDLPIMYDVVNMSIMEPLPKVEEVQPAPEPVPQAMPYPTGYPMPMPMPGYPYPVDPNMMAYPMDPNMPPPGYAYNPYYPPPMPGQPYPVAAPPPGWPYPPQAPPVPVVEAAPPPPPPLPEPSGTQAKLPVDYKLVSKRNKVQLGTLLLDSTLISETTLDAALKLQEMCEEGLCSADLAAKGLYKFHMKGQAIGEYLTDFDAVQLPERQRRAGHKPSPNQVRSHSGAQAKAAIDLLIKAGLVTEKDMAAAADVRQKVGGDIVQLLQSAGKLDKVTFDAAVVCLPLIREGLMRLEQCIIALGYCNRSRVDFDTALEEMGWQNPRVLRKDLFA